MVTDAIVVGAGVVGLAAGFELFRAGHRVTVVSAHVPGSRQSCGLSRIFRLAHADGMLTEAAAHSLQLWQEWEALAGQPLLERTGLLLTGDMADREVHLRAYGGLARGRGARHPLAVSLGEWAFESTGAAIQAEATVRFLQRGVDVVMGEVVSVERGRVVLAGGSTLEAAHVGVCAGPDTYELLGLHEPTRLRSVRFSFPLRAPLERPAPCWIHRDEELSEPFYAVMDGDDHYSIGLSAGASGASGDAGDAGASGEAGASGALGSEEAQIRDAYGRVLAIVERVFPGLEPVAERVINCEYTVNPSGPLEHDGWDLIEREGVVGVTGPSLFKFAPLLGRLVAERVGKVPV